jgi:hypothetical protein
MKELFDHFNEVRECRIKEEHFAVRDNGQVFRFPREGARLREWDNQWTFGKINKQTGYLTVVSIPVHRIVATAFHGAAPSSAHVVDHIDTNKQNNRPENLRWLTRLENILLNPISVKRIEYVTGVTILEFIKDPKKHQDKFKEKDFSWMRQVTREEAQVALQRLRDWATSKRIPSGGRLGSWLFIPQGASQTISGVEEGSRLPTMINAITPNAVQIGIKYPCTFPCCPQDQYEEEPLKAYQDMLIKDVVVLKNNIYEATVLVSSLSKEETEIFVITHNEKNIKHFALLKIYYANGFFVHESLGTFFEFEGANKRFTIGIGLEWNGGETFDDQVS